MSTSTSIENAYVEAQTRKLNAEAQILENSVDHIPRDVIKQGMEEFLSTIEGMPGQEGNCSMFRVIYDSMFKS